MRWTQEQPYTPLLTLDDVKIHLRLTDDDTEDDYLNALVASATAHAEQLMQSSLLTRSITATFYSAENLYLPRGPVQSIMSVALDGQPVASGAYTLEGYGTAVLLRYNNGTIQPHAAPAVLTVTYTAGYGSDPADVPADIIAAIRAYVGLLYENREAAHDRTIKPVPFLDDFFRLRGQDVGVG
jgi:uncharacterized phiE125 gp8 family phage protein